MPKRQRINATERKGVNYVRGIVEAANSVFREIDRAGDYGHDAFVLLVDGEAVTPVEIAVQIKSGRSFCRPRDCRFSASPAQLGFWAGHGLTTLGVIYDPDADCAWWVDLTEEAKARKATVGSCTIAFPKARWNRFDDHGFRNVLLPALLGTAPRLELALAMDWARDSDLETHDLGVRVLLARHREAAGTWEVLFQEFRQRGRDVSFGVIRGLIRIMGHTDDGYFSDEVPWWIREPRQAEILAFGKTQLADLLSFVGDQGFERGTAGWGLFAIVPPHPRGLQLLADVASDPHEAADVRAAARHMLAIHDDDPNWWGLWKPWRPPTDRSDRGGSASLKEQR